MSKGDHFLQQPHAVWWLFVSWLLCLSSITVLAVAQVHLANQPLPSSQLPIPSACETDASSSTRSATHNVQILANKLLERDGGFGAVLVDPTNPTSRSTVDTCIVNGWKTLLMAAVVSNVHCNDTAIKDPHVVSGNVLANGGCSMQIRIGDPCGAGVEDHIKAVLISVLVNHSSFDIFELVLAPNTTGCASHDGYACCVNAAGKEIPVMVQIDIMKVNMTSVNVVITPALRHALQYPVVMGGALTHVVFDMIRVETEEQIPSVSNIYDIGGGMRIVATEPILVPHANPFSILQTAPVAVHFTERATFVLRKSYLYKKATGLPTTTQAGAFELRVSLTLSNRAVFGLEGLQMVSIAHEHDGSDPMAACFYVPFNTSIHLKIMASNGSLWFAKEIDCHVEAPSRTDGFLFQHYPLSKTDFLTANHSSLVLFQSVRVIATYHGVPRKRYSYHTFFQLVVIANGSQLKFMNCTLLEHGILYARYFIRFDTGLTLENGGQFIMSSCGVEGTIIPKDNLHNYLVGWKIGSTKWIQSPTSASSASPNNSFVIRCSHVQNHTTLTLRNFVGGEEIMPHLKLVPQESSARAVCWDVSATPLPRSNASVFCDANIDCFGPATVWARMSGSSCVCHCGAPSKDIQATSDGAACLTSYPGHYSPQVNIESTATVSIDDTFTAPRMESPSHTTTRTGAITTSHNFSFSPSASRSLSETPSITQTLPLPVSADIGIVKLWTPEAQAVVSTATTSVAASTASGTAASDAQAMIIVMGGLSDCSKSAAVRSVAASGREVLSPLRIAAAGNRYDAVAGLIVILVVLAVVNVSIALLLHITLKRGSHWTAAFATGRCPSLSITGYLLAYPGLVQQMAFLALEDPNRTIGDVIAFLFLCVIVPGLLSGFLRIRLGHLRIRVFSTLGALSTYPHLLRRFVLPVGWWPSETSPKNEMFKSLLSPLKGDVRKWFWILLFVLSKSFIPAVVGSGISSCDAKIGILLAFQFGSAALVAVVRPFRVGMMNIATIVLSIMTGMTVVFIKLDDGAAAVQCALYTSILALCFSGCILVLKLFEMRWKKKERQMVPDDGDGDGELSNPLMDISHPDRDG